MSYSDKAWQALKESCARLASDGLSATSLGAPDSANDDAAFRQLFKSLWGAQATIKLSDAPPKADEEKRTVTIVRPHTPLPAVTAPGLLKNDPPDTVIAPVPCTLTAVFSLKGDAQIHAVLSFAVEESKDVFKSVFPSLPFAYEGREDSGEDDAGHEDKGRGVRTPPVLHGESVTNVRLIFTTPDAPPYDARLEFEADWSPTKLPATHLVLRGEIILPEAPPKRAAPLPDGALPWDRRQGRTTPPGIHLRAALPAPHPLWGDRKFDNPGFVFYSPLTRNWLLRNWDYEPRMAYTGTFILGKDARGDDVKGEGALVARTWDDFENEVMLVCSFENAKLDSVGEVLRLGAGLLSPKSAPPALDEVPEAVSTSVLTLDRAFIRTVKRRPAAFAVTLGLAGASWPIIDKKFEVALTKIGIMVGMESSSLDVMGTLTGTVKLWDDEPIEVTVELPQLQLQARQPKSRPLPLNKILGDTLFQGLPTLHQDIVIDDLDFRASLQSGQVDYEFSLRFQEGLKLSRGPLPSVQLSISNDVWRLEGSAEEDGFPIGELLEALAESITPTRHGEPGVPRGLVLPKAIQSFVITNFELEVIKGEPGEHNQYSFSCTGRLEVDGKQITAGVGIDFSQAQHVYNGWLSIGTRMFSFTAVTNDATKDAPASSLMVASYTHWGGGALSLSELMGDLLDGPTAEALDALKVELKDAFFVYTRADGSEPKYLFGVDFGAELQFKKLPLVGTYFASDIGIRNLQIVYAKDSYAASEMTGLRGLLPQSIRERPQSGAAAQPAGAANNTSGVALNKGLNIAADLNLGVGAQPLSLPTAAGPSHPPGTGAAPPAQATTTDDAVWLNIQKAVGPVHFERVGVEYRDSKLWVLLSASLNAAGLTISLDGLSLGAPLEGFDISKIEPDLRGLGIDYRNEVVEIGGSFLKVSRVGKPVEYGGAAVIKARGFTVSAIGSYTTVKVPQPGQPDKEESSFFIYGLLDYPMGGPPFFFVTGLAAGFGYNRSLKVPPVETLGQFPLIKAAQKDPATDTLDKLLPALRDDKDVLRAAPGEHFLAAGITFTSFKLVESTVLLTAAFGKRFELHLLGLSKLRVPAAELGREVSPVAEVELTLKGSFIPDDGFLELRAQLTPTSYLLSKDCHLSGGFAFLCWFKDGREKAGPKNGDFVLTLGGYHPAFQVPAHYPSVPRLGFNWQVIPDTLSLRGDVYFALTPAAVMAGGHLQAEWRSGSVFAWFKAGVDFLIAWKPYHYDARAYIDIGVEVTFEFFGTQRLSLDVGADLHIWGPEFQGDATVHLWIISFTIHFGNSKPSRPAAIGWKEFQGSFLLEDMPKQVEPRPAEKPGVCSVVVSDGLVHKGEGNNLGVINGKHFCLVTDSRIPSTAAVYEAHDGTTATIEVDGAAKTFGIAPMDVASVKSSTHTIIIKRGGEPVGDEFTYRKITKNVPAALWGPTLTPRLSGSQFVEETLCGFEIRPHESQESDATAAIDRGVLISEDQTPQSCRWEREAKPFNSAEKSEEEFKADLKATFKPARNALLSSLGIDVEGLDDSLTYDFLRQPQSEPVHIV